MKKITKYWYYITIGLIFILGFILRIKTYLLGRPLWHDEYSLAASILDRNILGLFQPLEFDQKAPALFMVLNKIAPRFFGISVLSLKTVPFISGLLSIVVFYFLSVKLLKNKSTIIIADFLFATNYQLIYWAQKFKQYSFDVLLFMSSLLLFTNLDLNKTSYKKCFLYSFLSLLLILASFPCAFVVGAYLLFCFLNKVDIKKTLSYSLPLIFGSVIYYFKVLYSVQTKEISNYLSYWNAGFLKLNIGSFLIVLKENFNFFFTPNNLALIGIILFITGLVLLFKNKSKISQIILLSLLGAVLASLLKIYPILHRTALYSLPIMILLFSMPLDLITKKKKTASVLIIVLFLTFFAKYNFSYFGSFFGQKIFLKTDGLTTFPKLIERYNNNDILVLNSTTKADFIYYTKIYKFNPQKVIILPIYRYDKEYYYSLIKTLPKGHNYWFIFGWEYSHRQNDLKNSIANHLKTYIKDYHLKVLEDYEDDNSILMKIKF